MHVKKSIFMLLSVLFLSILCTGCAKEITVKVNDSGETKEIMTKTKKTVEEALTEAKITLKDGDTTDPVRDSELTEDTTEITINRLCVVTIISGEDSKNLEVLGGTVQDAVDQAKIVLEEGQYIKEDTEDWLTNGMEIHVIQMKKVTVTADGSKQKVYTEAETIQDLLRELNITVGKKDRVIPKLTEKITDQTKKVTVQRVKEKKETETESISYEEKTVYSDNMTKGTSKVTTDGEEGSKEITYKVTYVDGKEESRKVVDEKVVKKPVTKVTTIGTKEVAAKKSSSGGGNSSSGGSSSSGGGNSSSSGNTSSESSGSSSQQKPSGGKTVVSKEKVYDCDGSGHGYYVITYSDGSVEYEDF